MKYSILPKLAWKIKSQFSLTLKRKLWPFCELFRRSVGAVKVEIFKSALHSLEFHSFGVLSFFTAH